MKSTRATLSDAVNDASFGRFSVRREPYARGADIGCVCREAGMFAIRGRRRIVTEEDFLNAVEKVIKGYKKFSAVAKYEAYNR